MKSRKPQRPRRIFSAELKQRVVQESYSGDQSVSEVARKYDIHASHLFKWRRALSQKTQKSVPGFLQVQVESEGKASNFPQNNTISLSEEPESSIPCLEITFPCGTQLRCGPNIEAHLLTQTLTTLRSLS